MISKNNPPFPADIYRGGRKRIFIGLLSATCLFICLALLALLILPWLGGHAALFKALCIGGGCAGIFLLAWLCGILIFHIHTKKPLPGVRAIRHLLIGMLLPLMEVAGGLFGIKKQIVRRSFIKVNNELAMANFKPVKPEKLLLLLPHCIQASKCPRRLAYSLDNCLGCGQCQIGEIIDLARELGIKLAIATGGTIARRIVVECKPEFIVAVACERDLAAGIQDCYPIPVFGLLNERPKGPCMDTLVPMQALRCVMPFFLEK